MGDGTCDAVCDVAACNHDDGDCAEETSCAPGCPLTYVGDNSCDDTCFVAACNYDDGDCDVSSETISVSLLLDVVTYSQIVLLAALTR